MVAISLYRGNLHRVPSGLRRWPFPRRSLTLNSFKILTRKRALALSRLSLQIKTKDEEKEELAPREDDEELDREGVGENGCHQRHLVPENDSSSPIEIKKEVASTEEPVQEPREVVDVGSLNTEDVVAGGDAVVEGKTEVMILSLISWCLIGFCWLFYMDLFASFWLIIIFLFYFCL